MEVAGEVVKVANGRLFVDTGSNGLVLPQTIYAQVLAKLELSLRAEGCSTVSEPTFSFFCRHLPSTALAIALSHNSSISVPLIHLCTMRANWCELRVWSGANSHSILVGSAVMRDYLVWFDWTGRMSIYLSRREFYSAHETINYQLAMLQYWLLLGLGVVGAHRCYSALQDNINRTQVI